MVAVAIGAAAVVGATSTVVAGNKGAKAQIKGADKAAANERYFYDTSRNDNAPWRENGGRAINKLASMYGVAEAAPTGAGAPGAIAAPYGGFEASPGYEWRRDEGLKAIERGAAARGALNSGAAIKAKQRFGDGLASSEYENYANRLASIAGVGQAATNATSAAGAQAAGGISAAYQNAGNARASSYANTAGAINSGINNVMSAYLYGQGGGFKPPTPTPPPAGYYGGWGG